MLIKKNQKILVVDDNEGVRYGMVWALTEAHFQALEATTGMEALQMLSLKPDLIILDIKLPDMSGFEVCRRIKDNPLTSSTPILHVSACYTSSRDREQGLDFGADGYLVHPIEAPELISSVNALLRAKEKETEAKAAAEEWQTTFNAIGDGICLVDRNGLIKRANQAMGALLTMEPQQLINYHLADVLLSSWGRSEELSTMLLEPDGNHAFFPRLKGGDKIYSVTIRRVEGASVEVGSLVFCFADVTERKRVEDELKRAKENAEDANRTKSAFLANMSHEIRTPLGALLGFSELLKDAHLLEEDRSAYIETINRNGRELGLLIDDILDLSKVEAGHLQIERIALSLPRMLVDLQSSLETKARDKGVRLVMDLATDVPETLLSDPTRLRQILINIIGNAVKFTAKGEVTVGISYEPDSLDKEGLVTFSVKDTGRGIGEDEVNKLFKPFSQADASTTRRFGGTGLGLVLARKLAQALGGDVMLKESCLGVGSTFLVTVAAGFSEQQNAMDVTQMHRDEPQRHYSDSDQPLKGIKILVAEDSLDNQLLIRRILSKCGSLVEIVSNGAQAVDRAMHGSFDVVLMDIQMPIMDGYDAAEELRSRGFKQPIIALTAHAMQGEREKCMRAGCDDHLPKPISHEKLVYLIQHYTAKKPEALNHSYLLS